MNHAPHSRQFTEMRRIPSMARALQCLVVMKRKAFPRLSKHLSRNRWSSAKITFVMTALLTTTGAMVATTLTTLQLLT